MSTLKDLIQKLRIDTTEYKKGLDATVRQAEGFKASMSNATKVAAVGVAAVGAAAIKLAADAAPLESVARSFESLGGNIEKMRQGAAGMATDADLMKSYNSAAQLISTQFAEKLPDAMGYLSKVSAATGQDMGFMIDSLVKGVGRMSPMILDNLGIQVALSEATSRAAQMYGVEEAALSKAQQQAGMMAVVMEKLKANTAAMPEVIGTTAQRWAAFNVSIQNVKNQAGSALLPVLEAILPILEQLGAKLTTALASDQFVNGVQATADRVGKLVDWLTTLDPTAVKVGAALIGMGLALPKVAAGIQGAAAAFKLLNLALAANPIMLIATGLVAAGAIIVGVVSAIKKETAQLEKEQSAATESAMKTAKTYEEYESAMAKVLVPMGDFEAFLSGGEGRTLEQYLNLKGVAADAVLAREEFEKLKAAMPVEGSMGDQLAKRGVNVGAAGVSMPTDQAAGGSLTVTGGAEAQAAAAQAEAEAIGAKYAALQQLAMDHNAAMQSIEDSAAASAQEREFSYLMQRTQARAQYQGERAALAAAGATEEVAKLDEKYQRETAMMEGQHRTEILMAQRTELLKRRDQLLSYLQGLVDQGQFSQAKLNGMKARAMGELTMTHETGKGVNTLEKAWNEQDLKADQTKYKGQLEMQKTHSIAMLNMLDKTRNAAMTLQSGGAAEAEFNRIMAELDANMQATLSSVTDTYSGAAFDAGAAVGGGMASGIGAGAAESATKAMTEVTQDIDTATSAMLATIERLEDVEVPAGIESAFDKLGEFFKTAVSKFYGWLTGETKTQFDALKDELEPLTQLAGVGKAYADAVAAFNQELPEEGAIDQGFVLIEKIHEKITTWLGGKTEDQLKELETTAKASESAKKAMGVISVNYEQMADVGKLQAAYQNTDLYFALAEKVGTKIMDWLKGRPKEVYEQIAEVAEASENTSKLFSVASLDFSKMIPDNNSGKLEQRVTAHLAQIEMVAPLFIETFDRIQRDWGEALERVLPVGELIAKVTGVLSDVASNINTMWDSGMLNTSILAQGLRQLHTAAQMIGQAGLSEGFALAVPNGEVGFTTTGIPQSHANANAEGNKQPLVINFFGVGGALMGTYTGDLDEARQTDVNLLEVLATNG